MKSIKYIVVCKEGYMFTSEKKDIIEFIEKHGKTLAYYIGNYSPIKNLNGLFINTNLEELGEVSC